MTPQTSNTCRKLRVSAFQPCRVYLGVADTPALRGHGDSQTVVFFPPKTSPRHFQVRKDLHLLVRGLDGGTEYGVNFVLLNKIV